MARRKRKRFGSVSLEHITQANYAITTARMHTGNAVMDYRGGKCLGAGTEIDKAYVAIGKATAHLTSTEKRAGAAARIWDQLGSVKQELKAIDESFERTCVRKSPVKAGRH